MKRPYRDERGRFAKRPVVKKPVRKRPAKKPVPRKPERGRAKKPVRKAPKKRVPRQPPVPPRPPSKVPPGRPPRGPSRPPRPPIPPESLTAESKVQQYLGGVLDGVASSQRGFDAGMKTFVNADGSVDGEVRVGGLPDEWRVPDGLVYALEFLSEILGGLGTLVPGDEGGRYWISIGVRFGPSNETEIGELAELYKRHRGLFQVASYALDLGIPGAAQNAVVAVGEIMKAIMQRRGLPPTVVFVRVTWTPDGVRPRRYEGESGK